MRGAAALLVVISHCANHGLLPRVFGHGVGQMGVALFFTLSGFLMAHLYLDQPFDRGYVARYARNRIGRVAPLYFLLVVLSLTPAPLPHPFAIEGRALEHLLLLHGLGVLWTIPVEIHFYIAFVGLWWAAARGRLWVALLLFAATMAVLALVLHRNDVDATWLPFWSHFFLAGSIAALAGRRWSPSILSRRGGGWLGWVACFLFAAAVPELRRQAGMPVVESFLDPLFALAALLLFVATLAAAGPLRLLAAPIARWVGTISYGIYLLHYPVLKLVYRIVTPNSAAERAATLLSVVLLTIVLAALSHYLFERPVQRLIRSRGRRATVAGA